MATIVTGLQAAITDRASHPTAPVAASLILCLVRELGEAAAAATLALTLPYLTFIESLGLASSEVRVLSCLNIRQWATMSMLIHQCIHQRSHCRVRWCDMLSGKPDLVCGGALFLCPPKMCTGGFSAEELQECVLSCWAAGPQQGGTRR